MKQSSKQIIGATIALGTFSLFTIGVTAKDADFSKGKEVYEGTCIACHGESGKGDIPGAPNFTKANGPLSKADTELLTNIIEGYESPGSDMPMPAKGGDEDLSDEDIEAVLAYIRNEFGSKSK